MKRFKRCCCMMLAMIIGICSVGIDTKVYAEELQDAIVEDILTEESVEISAGDVIGMESDAGEMVDSERGWDQETTESIFEADNYKVIFTLSGAWDGGYHANVVIENVGEAIIENWSLKFPYGEKIENFWNAELVEYADGRMTIRNVGWNRDIPVGGSVSFGFSGTRDFVAFPEEYELVGETAEVSNQSYLVEYYISSDWGSGFTGGINITNNTQETIEDWTLEFDFGRTIDSIWCADIVSVEAGHYVVRNQGYNADIRPGQKVNFGFMGSEGIYEDEPANYHLYSYGLYENDKNSDAPNMDTDGDGLSDGFEKEVGLDYQNADTDGDGLTDYEELYMTWTNPLLTDTDENGISDSDEDLDGDGLANKDEIIFGTDPASADTDGDNLTDYEELFIYDTNPLLPDTDRDGLTDYEDVVLGFSPLMADTNGNGILDADEKLPQTVEESFDSDEGRGLVGVEVSMEVAGGVWNHVGITNLYGVDLLSSDVVGLVGVPVDIHVDVEFDKATLVFCYDETMLGDVKEENLSILWYDEAGNQYRMLDSVVDTVNNTVSYETTHFSTYMLVDSEAWCEAWRRNIDYCRNGQEGKYLDVVFVMEVEESMSGEPLGTARTIVSGLVDSLQDGDMAAFVEHHGNGKYFLHTFTSDPAKMKNGINGYGADCLCFAANGLDIAAWEFIDRQSNNQKLIVWMCDREIGYSTLTINDCIKRNIKVCAVNLAYEPSHVVLEKIVDLTGGQYYYGTVDSIDTMLGFVQGGTTGQVDTTDLDGDGLYDVYETAGIRLLNGQVIYTDPSKVDTDGDGLSDFDEVGLLYRNDMEFAGGWTAQQVEYFILQSDPTKADTDDDGLRDYVDKHPWRKDFEWVAQLDSGFDGVDYLRIQQADGSWTNGGNQSWWRDKVFLLDELNKEITYENYVLDPYYRLVRKGCGVIAMSNLELYMAQQNANDGLSNLQFLDKNTGIILEEDYRKYVEDNYQFKYWLNDFFITYQFALTPQQMKTGMEAFLLSNQNGHHFVKWAPHHWEPNFKQRNSVLNEIESMLEDNVPVVFSYYTSDENDRIIMYTSLEEAKAKDASNPNHQEQEAHYMTIIGLYKYLDDTTSGTQYILKVESWGNIYYIRYDQYADHLSYFSNILRVS